MTDTSTSRLNSMVLGDTKLDDAPEPVTNVFALLAVGALFAWLWFINPVFFLFAAGLVVMIFLHELGHYMTSRWTGMKATQFFIGMGPTIFSRHRIMKNGDPLEYGLKALPLGAFVRIIGMNNLDPVDPSEEHRAYRSASFPRRMLVITAGSIMHFIQAILLFALAFSVIGQPDSSDPNWAVREISQLETGETPSVEAGIQIGDRIAAIDGEPLADWAALVEAVRAMPGETVTMDVVRNGETIPTDVTFAVVPTENVGDIGYLGIAPSFPRAKQSPLLALEATWEIGVEAVSAIPRFFSPSGLANLAGLLGEERGAVDISSEEAQERPISLVGAVRIAGTVAERDWASPIALLAALNVFIGVLNLMPLLPLDGGHAVIAMYERLRTRDLSKPYRANIEKLLPLTYVVVAVFAFVGLSTVYLDIFRPIG